jgi:hypothetical protein
MIFSLKGAIAPIFLSLCNLQRLFKTHQQKIGEIPLARDGEICYNTN